MPRILPLDLTTAEPDVRATLDAVRASIGMVPNLFATFARSPAVLKGYLALSEALNNGLLSVRQREIAALAVAQANECHYCLSAHTAMGKGAGLSPESILAARHGTGQDAADKAVAGLASRLLETRGHITDADLAAAREGGLSDGQIVEIVGAAAINVFTNFMNNLAQTEIDFPKVEIALAA